MPRKKKVTEKPMTLSMRDAKAGTGRQMIPADNVDAEGTAWATVGENIRKGSRKEPNKEDVLNMISTLLGIEVTIEEVNAKLNGSNGNIIVDNNLFTGYSSGITSTKKIISFFVIDSVISSGYIDLSLTADAYDNVYIHLSGASSNNTIGNIKFAVLVA